MTLRTRLLIGMGAVALVLIVASILVAGSTRSYLLDQIDEQLDLTEPAVRRFVSPPVDRPGLSEGQDRFPEGDPPNFTSIYLAVINRDGSIEPRAPDLVGDDEGTPFIDVERAFAEGEAADPEPYTVASDGGADYRIQAVYVSDTDQVVVVGRSLAELDSSMERLMVVEAVAVALVLAVLGLVTFWVVRHGVRPVKRMTATATAIAGGDLSHRVEAAHPGTEAAELGEALNTMLGRIQEAFDEKAESEERLRQFVADASHELRTPVTSIRGYAELYNRGGLDDRDELGQAMVRMEHEATRMGGLIDDLLLLARLDQGRPLDRGRVDLARLAADAVADASVLVTDRSITVHADGPAMVEGDEHRLRQVVANLVTNAVVHTPPGTPVTVRTEQRGDRQVLEVGDDGPGMTADAAAHAFERFWRADSSRTRHRGGAGLGLPIVKAIVEAHRGTVSLHSVPGHGTTVTVSLPV